jgi:hypothetical protein
MLFDRLKISALCAVILFSFACTPAVRKLDENHLRDVRTPHSKTKPHPGDQAIKRAIKMFAISVPKGIGPITYDHRLPDRGLTVWRNGKIRVTIGRKAFASWGILGSTLAHELEVHARQNFRLIAAAEMIGLPGKKWAERQAYDYEISSSRRFRLSQIEIQRIANTRERYYSY